MSTQEDMMHNYPPSLAATKKLGSLPDGFSFFMFEWLGDRPEEWTVMKVTGAVFREAKSGPRKGQRVIRVPGSERTVYVMDRDIEAETPNVAIEGPEQAQLANGPARMDGSA